VKVALVYDRVNKWGGAERVLLALHEMFPGAPLYTSVYGPRRAPWAKVFPKIYTSFIQKIPFAKNSHELLGWLMPLAFESFNFDQYDLVISVTSEAAKGVITKPQTKHLCYCLTPTRYLWSGYEEYFPNPIMRWLTQPIVKYLRNWDRVAAQRPDVMVAVSTAIKERIKKYYGRESKVIFPPGGSPRKNSLLRVSPQAKTSRSFLLEANRPYYLVVARLVPYKKVDLAVRAFNKLGLPLVVIGTGSEQFKLKLKSKKNIKFVGQVSDEELARYYRGAKALIMPQEEDFGLVAVEAQGFGVPVIAYQKGGAKDTVIDGKTGLFFDQQNPESLSRVIRGFDKHHFNEEELILHAGKFSKANFKKGLLKLINQL